MGQALIDSFEKSFEMIFFSMIISLISVCSLYSATAYIQKNTVYRYLTRNDFQKDLLPNGKWLEIYHLLSAGRLPLAVASNVS